MSQDIEKIKDRISKMLATASCKASTPAEKSTAMQMASALMRRYNLDREDVEGKDKGEFSEVLVETLLARMMPWESQLAAFVSSYVVKGSWVVVKRSAGAIGAVNESTIAFVGLGADPQIAAATYCYLRQLLVAESAKIYGTTVRGSGRSYAVGFVSGLIQVAKETEASDRMNSETGTALIRTDMLKRQSENWYLAKTGRKVSNTTTRIGGIKSSAYNRGVADGRSTTPTRKHPISARLN